ncbi:MAG: hypothetical protein L3K03_07685 [Thermoplasmata archaeon]|nr:hypothetical protein [Thermoplasmata archaeon]
MNEYTRRSLTGRLIAVAVVVGAGACAGALAWRSSISPVDAFLGVWSVVLVGVVGAWMLERRRRATSPRTATPNRGWEEDDGPPFHD